jgi:hypothetical protein
VQLRHVSVGRPKGLGRGAIRVMLLEKLSLVLAFGAWSRRAVDSQPAHNRLVADPVSTPDRIEPSFAQPAPDGISSQAQAPNRLFADDAPASVAPRQVRPVKEHVAALFACIGEQFAPGDVIESDVMAEVYAHVCTDNALVPRAWNPIAAQLKKLMAKGPRGASKPYAALLRADGTKEVKRIWIVPERASEAAQPARQATWQGEGRLAA